QQLVKIFRDETSAKQAEDQRVLLLNELNHRVKNTLATVQSIVEQTLRSAGVDGHVRDDLTERLIALARAHNVLVSESWAGADLDVLIGDVLAPHDRTPSPFNLDGPPVRLHPSQAVTLSMSLHELVTNALKYGALSTAGGQVDIGWNLAHDGNGARHLVLVWKEHGGPPVAQPTRTGFGSRMLRSAFANQPGGRAELTFGPDGVTCVLAAGLVDDAHTPNDTIGAEPGSIG
ncbi:MAG: sensor histidine kinase, partial [Caulobacteraceae bacterium]